MGGKKWATRFALAAAFAYAAAKVAGRWRKADLRGEVAVIVGGSRGLGLMIARELAAAGCRLVIGARDVDQLRVALVHVSHLPLPPPWSIASVAVTPAAGPETMGSGKQV